MISKLRFIFSLFGIVYAARLDGTTRYFFVSRMKYTLLLPHLSKNHAVMFRLLVSFHHPIYMVYGRVLCSAVTVFIPASYTRFARFVSLTAFPTTKLPYIVTCIAVRIRLLQYSFTSISPVILDFFLCHAQNLAVLRRTSRRMPVINHLSVNCKDFCSIQSD